MIVRWEPGWYELDQSIVVGDIDLFYLSKDKSRFANGFAGDDDYEVRAEVLSIHHPDLGDIKGIIAIGLDYTIYLGDGGEIIVDAEECPGEIEGSQYIVNQWNFDVEINIIEETGMSSKKRLEILSTAEKKTNSLNRIQNYKRLLDLKISLWEKG